MTQKELQVALEKWHQEAYGWALRCCAGDHNLAADALQTVYLKILEGQAIFKKQSSFKTWLFSVIRFTVIDSFRKQKRERQQRAQAQEVLQEQPHSPDPQATQDLQVFRKLLDQLSNKQQEVLQLVFYHDCSLSEAAEVMKISLGSARQHYARAKENLRKKLIAQALISTDK